jgi:RND family efflux transporter MFP subunit
MRLSGRATACLLAACFAACGGGAGPDGSAKPAVEPKQVRLLLPSSLMTQTKVEVTGSLAPDERSDLGFQVPGRIVSLDVDVGDQVAAGQAIAALDLADFDLECARAEAALQVARVRLSLPADADASTVDAEQTAPVREAKAVLVEAGLARDRVRELAAQGLGSQATLDTAVAAVSVAQSRLQAAEEQVATWLAELSQRKVELALAQKRRADAQLKAPFAGRVESRPAASGSFVQQGARVVTLLRTDPLRLRLRVPERQAHLVAIGQQVAFAVDGDVGGAPMHTAVVRRLGPSIDLVDRTLLVEAEVKNPDGALRSGAFCRATIATGAMRTVVAAPKSAIASFAGVDRVYCVQDGRIKDALVEIGITVGDSSGEGIELVEIVRGLAPDQKFVADPRGLVPGMPVKTVD